MGCSSSSTEEYYEEYFNEVSQTLIVKCETCGRKHTCRLESKRIYKKGDNFYYKRCAPNCKGRMVVQAIYVPKNRRIAIVYGYGSNKERYTMANDY